MGFGPGRAQDLGYFLASFAGDGLTGKEIEKPPERVRGRESERVWVPHSPEKDRRFIFFPRWWGWGCCQEIQRREELLCLLILKNEVQLPFPLSLQGWAKGPNPDTPPSISYSFPNLGLRLAVSFSFPPCPSFQGAEEKRAR